MTSKGTLAAILNGIAAQRDREAVRNALSPIVDRFSSMALSSAGLAIKAGSSAIVKTGATDQYLIANGIMRKITAATDMAALSGTVANATFNAYSFFIDSAGTVTSQMGTAGATLVTMKLAPQPQGKALIGFVIINPTGTGDFVGGTTALDDGTVTPTAVYVNPVGPFDSSFLLGF